MGIAAVRHAGSSSLTAAVGILHMGIATRALDGAVAPLHPTTALLAHPSGGMV